MKLNLLVYKIISPLIFLLPHFAYAQGMGCLFTATVMCGEASVGVLCPGYEDLDQTPFMANDTKPSSATFEVLTSDGQTGTLKVTNLTHTLYEFASGSAFQAVQKAALPTKISKAKLISVTVDDKTPIFQDCDKHKTASRAKPLAPDACQYVVHSDEVSLRSETVPLAFFSADKNSALFKEPRSCGSVYKDYFQTDGKPVGICGDETIQIQCGQAQPKLAACKANSIYPKDDHSLSSIRGTCPSAGDCQRQFESQDGFDVIEVKPGHLIVKKKGSKEGICLADGVGVCGTVEGQCPTDIKCKDDPCAQGYTAEVTVPGGGTPTKVDAGIPQ